MEKIRKHLALAKLASGLVYIIVVAMITACSQPPPAAPLVKAPAPVAPAKPAFGSCRLMAANLMFNNHDLGPFLKLVAEENPDLIVLSEYTPDHATQLASLRQSHPYFREFPQAAQFGIAVFSRRHAFKFSLEQKEGQPAWIHGSWSGMEGEIELAAVHFYPPISQAGSQLQSAQMDSLRKLFLGKSYLLMAGDFNASRLSPALQTFCRELKLHHADLSLIPQATFPASSPLGIDLDHLLASPTFQLSGFRVSRPFGSDHRAIVAEIKIKP